MNAMMKYRHVQIITGAWACTNVITFTIYGSCHKKLYKIRGLSASVICRFSAASSRISVESSKGVRGIVKGFSRNCKRVSVET